MSEYFQGFPLLHDVRLQPKHPRDTPQFRAALIAGILADFASDHRQRSPAEVMLAAYERHDTSEAEAGAGVTAAIQTLVAARLIGCSKVNPETGFAVFDEDAVLAPTIHLAVYATVVPASTVRN